MNSTSQPRESLNYYKATSLVKLLDSPSEERLRQAGKNPRRVGADFHRNLAKEDSEDDNWSVCGTMSVQLHSQPPLIAVF